MTFKPGQSGNPKGRPKKALIDIFEKAIRKVEKVKGKTIFQHFAERAYDDDGVLIAVMKKRLPDMKQVEGTVKLDVDLIAMTIAEKLAYEKVAQELAQQEIQKQITEGGEEE